MWSLLLFLSLSSAVSGTSFQCPTNVTCVDKETCCQTATGLWACCPIEDGLCCDDGLHCCPKGSKCSPDGNCSSSVSFNELSAAIPLRFKDVQCQDGSTCPDGSTCCQLSSGQYGCCPIPDAVCCSDHVHCCPHGYTCDVEHSRCKKQFDEVNDVPCPGGSSACPDGETCCQLESGDYGCCPLSDAVCCSDHLHCCPHGYRCDTEKSQCLRAISIPWLEKKPSIPRFQPMTDLIDEREASLVPLNVQSTFNTEIICPDATSLCPSTSTCCLTADANWGCCPVQDAACCSDHHHCCPKHYKCDLHVFKCDHPQLGSIPLLKKQPSRRSLSSALLLANSQSTVATIQCPDDVSFCPEETTCCPLDNGAYGCCPYAQASCCSDKIHCCGNGYSCDQTGQRCIRHFSSSNETMESQPAAVKFASLKKKESLSSLIPLSSLGDQLCPDGKTKCSPTSTCCSNEATNDYACCPYARGVCCGSNGSVCCPNNYNCDKVHLSCQLSQSNFLRSAPLTSDSRQCASSDVACSYDQTCCRTFGSSDGGFACCAFADAQCCEDGRHCCPRGTTCDIHSGGCKPKPTF